MQGESERQSREAITSISGGYLKTNKPLSAQEKRLNKVRVSLEDALLHASIGLLSIPATANDGIAVASALVPLSASIMDVAKVQPKFLDVLERSLEYSVYSALAANLAILAATILYNHGIDVPAMIGIKPKEKPEEKKQKSEVSEEDRARLFTSLLARQQEQAATLEQES